MIGVDVDDAHVVRLEDDLAAGGEAGSDEILHDLVLAVDGDGAPAGELAQRDAVADAVELEVEPFVDEPFAIHALADTGVAQQVDRGLLEDAGAQPVLDVRAIAPLDDDRVYAGERQQSREDQPCRASAYNRDLGALAGMRG
jgi:hypothetical protein